MELILDNLSKIYPNGTKAMDSISIKISSGMFGLLGPNGAGKSTLMRTLATLQAPDTGTVLFNGFDIFRDQIRLRKELGYLPQEFGVYPRMSALNLLDYLAQLKGVSSKKERRKLVDFCLEITNLTGVKKKAVNGYSGGMKQRFGIAQLLLNDPSLIIVDEPTAGLDPAERQHFLNILREISTKKIVIFSTHIVEDIKDLCTDMAIMNRGKILVHNRPSLALENLKGRVFYRDVPEENLESVKQIFRTLSANYNRDNSIRVRALIDDGLESQWISATPTLEDYYFYILNDYHV